METNENNIETKWLEDDSESQASDSACFNENSLEVDLVNGSECLKFSKTNVKDDYNVTTAATVSKIITSLPSSQSSSPPLLPFSSLSPSSSHQKKKEINEPVLLINRALCADYRSDSDFNESSSDYESSDGSECGNGNVKSTQLRKELGNKSSNGNTLNFELPFIEELKISVPEKSCIEIGSICSIVETLVIVESYKGTPPLDVDTVLFLECGKKPLGKIYEILGPVSEPVYSIRFNSHNDIVFNKIIKGLKVYYAPETQHTTFVLLSDVLKCKGSDASWKDNLETPTDFQDFSDDEEEIKFKNKLNNSSDEYRLEERAKKRTFDSRHGAKIIQRNKVKNFDDGLNKTNFNIRLGWKNHSKIPSLKKDFPTSNSHQSHYDFPLSFNEMNSLHIKETHNNCVPTLQNQVQYYQYPKYCYSYSDSQTSKSFQSFLPRGLHQYCENSFNTIVYPQPYWPATNQSFVFLPPPPPPLPPITTTTTTPIINNINITAATTITTTTTITAGTTTTATTTNSTSQP